MQLSDALTEYRYAILEHAPKTREWYEQKLVVFLAWCESDGVDLADLKPLHLRRFLAYLRERPNERYPERGNLSDNTVKGYAQVMKGFLTFCAKEELISERLAKQAPIPHVESKVIQTFTREQVKRLFTACGLESFRVLAERDRAILAVLLDTGIRASELCGLRLENAFLQPNDGYLLVDGKGRKQREVGLGKEARTHVHRYIYRYRDAPRSEHHIFVGRRRQPMTPYGLDQMLYRLRDWAGIVGIRCSAHTFRHTFAVSYLAAGGDIYKLSRLMGHSNVSTTEIYLRDYKDRDARKGPSVLDQW